VFLFLVQRGVDVCGSTSTYTQGSFPHFEPRLFQLNFVVPGASLRVDGVLPIYLSSTVMSAPSGVDFTSTDETAGAGSVCVAAGEAGAAEGVGT
jgi:hypothetical protein